MVTSSGITIDGKVYRNLESQVAYNAEKIEQLLAGGGGGGFAASSVAIQVEVQPSMWTVNPASPLYQNCTIPYPSGITAANAIWCNPDIYFYKIKQDYIVASFFLDTNGFNISIMSPAAPINIYTFQIIFIPTTSTSLIAIDATNYQPEVPEGLNFFQTLTFSSPNWTTYSGTAKVATWSSYEFSDIRLNYENGYNIYISPADYNTSEFISKYDVRIANPLLMDACTFIAWRDTSSLATRDLNFNVWTESNTTSSSYIFLQQ